MGGESSGAITVSTADSSKASGEINVNTGTAQESGKVSIRTGSSQRSGSVLLSVGDSASGVAGVAQLIAGSSSRTSGGATVI